MTRNRQDFNKDTFTTAINRKTNNILLPKPLTDISDQAWKGFMVSKNTTYIEFDSDSQIRRNYTVETDTNEITKVEDDGSGNIKVTTASNHGYDNGDDVILGMFDTTAYNAQGTVSSKTDQTFVVTEISFNTDDTGYVVKTTDQIEGNESRFPANTILTENVPWGLLPDYYPNFYKEGATTYGTDSVIVVHVKQVTSQSSSNIRITER